MVEPAMSMDSTSNATTNEDDDILKYLLSDTPPSGSDFSSPDRSPLSLVLEDSNSDASPPYWVSEDVSSTSDIPDINLALGNNNDLLFNGDDFGMDYTTIPMAPAPIAEVAPGVVPSLTPPQQTINPKKVNRSKKRPRASTPPPIPSPEQNAVALSRDTLLQISSQSMDRYVENLSSSRALTLDDQKELKRQKRLIKNRESAQLSRERKRAYIDQLEERISNLLSENTTLKSENTTLRQALSRYTGETTTAITPSTMEVSADLVHRKQADPVSQHITKMAGLLTSATTIGSGRATSTTAKAGVCLLIVLFTFGLFMNSNGPRGGLLIKRDASPDIVSYHERALMPQVNYRRSILEAPEVLDETDDYIDNYSNNNNDQLIIPNNDNNKVQRRMLQEPVHVKPAGIYKVSYSPEPAKLVPVQGQRYYQKQDDNSTYMLFLDPRPDLDNDGVPDVAPTPTPTSTPAPQPTTSDLQVSTHTHNKGGYTSSHLPPMIISLVVPEHIANGSNPLFPKEGYFSADSLMELTCQVVDVSITTSERPHKH